METAFTVNGNGNFSDGVYVYVKQYTNRWGKVMRAADYGKEAFRFLIRNKKKRRS